MIRMEIFDNQIPVFGQADDRTLSQIRVCARTAEKVALMPDNHVGYGVPIGGVVAYRNAISPTVAGSRNIGSRLKTESIRRCSG